MAIGMTAPNSQPFFNVVARSTNAYTANAVGFIANVANGDINDLENAGCVTWFPSALTQTGISNLQSSNTTNLRKAINSVANGLAPVGPFVVIGDSTSRNSVGATTAVVSWPAALAALLTKHGFPARNDSWFGVSNIASLAAYTTFDSRFVAGTGWALGQTTAGGNYVKWPGSLTPTALAFTPVNAFNQVDVYYLSNSGAQTLNLDRSGTAPTTATLNTNAALSSHKATFTWSGVSTTGTFNITPASSGASLAFILGVVCRDTTAPHLDIINMSWAGSSSADWVNAQYAGAGYDPLSLIKLTAPAAGVIAHFVNDYNTGTTSGGSASPTALPTYSANIAAIAAALQATGDALLTDGPQSNPANFSSAAMGQSYIAVLQTLATSLNVPFWDRQILTGSFSLANALGLMADDRHGSPAYSGQDARTALKLLTSF